MDSRSKDSYNQNQNKELNSFSLTKKLKATFLSPDQGVSSSTVVSSRSESLGSNKVNTNDSPEQSSYNISVTDSGNSNSPVNLDLFPKAEFNLSYKNNNKYGDQRLEKSEKQSLSNYSDLSNIKLNNNSTLNNNGDLANVTTITGENSQNSLLPTANELPNIQHMDQLILSMMNLLKKYSEDEKEEEKEKKKMSNNSFNNSHTISPSHSLYFISNKTKDEQEQEKKNKLSHQLITVMRDSVPLNYLVELNKKQCDHPIKWHPCRYNSCFNTYRSKGSLHRHVYSHTGERPYICQYPGCDKSYSASDRLSEHMHSHTNQRPYQCKVLGCDKAYNDPKTLREHKKTHGEKSFFCPISNCGKSFHRKTHLKQHMRTHNKDVSYHRLFTKSNESSSNNSNQTNNENENNDENDDDSNNTINKSEEGSEEDKDKQMKQSPNKSYSTRSLLNNNDNKHFRIQKRSSPEL